MEMLVFGRLAVLSPSLWWDHRSILNLATRVHPLAGMRMWLDMGTAEGVRHLRDADLLYKALVQHGWAAGETLLYTRVQDGLHNEEAWAHRFGDVLRFLFPAE
jgi:predicted alpha/beta superfamily hydrolase